MQGITMNNTECVTRKNTYDQLQILTDSLNQILGPEKEELDKLSLADTINRMIQTALENLEITSTPPRYTNMVTSVDERDMPDLEEEVIL